MKIIKNFDCKVVFGEGPKNAKIMFIGEAPGKQEVKLGEPFVGPAGKFLDKELKKIGLKRKRIYITSVLKCRLPLTKSNIKKHAPILFHQIKTIKPKIIVLLGKIASETLLRKFMLKKEHGDVFKINNTFYLVTFHPSAARRFPKIMKLFERDFKTLKNLIKKLA